VLGDIAVDWGILVLIVCVTAYAIARLFAPEE